MKKNNSFSVSLKAIKEYWVNNPCEDWFFGPGISCNDINKINLDQFKLNSSLRYSTLPEILSFGDFSSLTNLNVLEVGYGIGSDSVLIAKSANKYSGIDLSEKSFEVTSKRLKLYGLNNTNLTIGTSTNLPYPDNTFDFVYSWGVVHHSGNIKKSLAEIYRVLKEGGRSKIMIYNKNSLVVFVYWLLYSIKDFNFTRTRAQIIADNIESPGTLILSRKEFKYILKSIGFSNFKFYLYRDFFYILRKYPRLLRPFIRIFAKCISILLGGEKNIGYFMCVDIIK